VFLLRFVFAVSQAQSVSSTWATETSLPVAVQEAAVTALNNQVYVVGGSNSQPTPPPTPNPDVWTFCANEGQWCSFAETRRVRYGANGAYNYGTFEENVPCTNEVFGDPIIGVVKQCEYGASTTPTFLRDEFEDNVRNTAKWYRGTVSEYAYAETSSDGHFTSDMLVKVLEQNQRLEITPRTNASGPRYNGYVSVKTYDFTNKNASVEIVQAPNSVSYADLSFAVAADSNNLYRFVIENGWLRFDDKAAGTLNTANKITYSPTQHKFLRIKHDQATNTIIWETSPDRATWTPRRTLTPGISITMARMELGAGTYLRESQPGVVIFDSFRLEPNIATGTNKPAIADAGGPYTVTTTQPVQFDGSGSYDSDGTVSAYEWDFGDGARGTGARPTHTYASLGTYVVVLTITDNGGATNSARTKATQIDPAVVGQWSRIIDLPILAVHTHVLPDGKVLLWQHEATSTPYVWDVNNGIFDAVPIHSNQNGTRRDSIYCSGHSFLPDGRLFVTGGHIEPRPDDFYGSKLTNIFDYTQNRWSSGPDMNDGRWYPSNVTLANGATLILSGSIRDDSIPVITNDLPQVYEANGQLRSLTGAVLSLPLYPMVHLAPNGKVFVSGP